MIVATRLSLLGMDVTRVGCEMIPLTKVGAVPAVEPFGSANTILENREDSKRKILRAQKDDITRMQSRSLYNMREKLKET